METYHCRRKPLTSELSYTNGSCSIVVTQSYGGLVTRTNARGACVRMMKFRGCSPTLNSEMVSLAFKIGLHTIPGIVTELK